MGGVHARACVQRSVEGLLLCSAGHECVCAGVGVGVCRCACAWPCKRMYGHSMWGGWGVCRCGGDGGRHGRCQTR